MPMSFFGLQFEHAWVLILILMTLPLYVLLTRRARKRSLIPYPPIQYQKGSPVHKIFFGLLTFFELSLIVLLFVSLAKPYQSTETVSIEEDGLDVLLTIDVSASMQATDFTPNRLEATKDILHDFVRRSGGNRIGMIVFGKNVFVLSPLTTDHLVLHELINGLSLSTIDHYLSGGTAIGDAILMSTDILKNVKIPGRDQVIILLTDGDNNSGMDAKLATRYAVENNIKIHTIGLGSTQDVVVKPDPKIQPDWSFTSKLVEAPLIEIAQMASGRYFHALNDDLLIQIFQEISRLERTPLEVDKIQQKKYYRFQVNVILGLLFFLALLIRTLFLRRPMK